MTRNIARASTLLLIAAFGIGCSGDRQQPPDENEIVLESIEVSAPALMIEKDEQVRFTATGSFSDGSTEDLTGEVTWASSETEVASIAATGVVTGLRAGSTKISATVEDVSGSATLTVLAAAIESLEVQPDQVTLAPGDSEQLVAVATLADGSTVVVTDAVVWSSSDEGVATVAAGLVTGVVPGAAVISAMDATTGIGSDDTDQSAMVTVRDPPPTSLVVEPMSVSLPAGLTQQLTATAHYEDGSSRDVTAEVAWASSAAGVAEVSSVGLVTAVSDGLASITARHEASGLEDVSAVRVTLPEISRITVTPPSAMIEVNGTQDFGATAIYTDGSERSVTRNVMWVSSDPSIATVSNAPGEQGRAEPVVTGTVTISAVDPNTGISSDDSDGSATLTIVPPALVSVMVVPPATTIPVGLTTQLRAFGIYSDNLGQEITNAVIWSSTDDGVATVDAAGLVTAVATGTTTIIAVDPVTGISSEDGQSSSQVTVDPPILLSIAVTPPTVSMVVGSSQQFTATGRFSDSVARDMTTLVTWSSSSPALTISPAGFASAESTGNVVISATDPASGVSSGDSNESATALISDAVLLSLEVTPAIGTVPPGADLQFVAMGTYDNGAIVDLTSLVSWTSLDPTVAAISNAAGARGVASAQAPGMTTISAVESFSGVSSDDSGQSATLTVPAGVTLQSIDVNPDAVTIGVNRTFPFVAQGTFSDASVHPMSNSVSWSSSVVTVATVSNVEGSRGLVTGVEVGTSVIAATHTPSGISSGDTNGSAVVTVERTIQIADVVHYEIEEGMGTTLTNSAPGQPNGTINGAHTWNTPGNAPGGSTYFLTMANGGTNNVDPNLTTATYTDLTIEFWWRFGSGIGLAYMWDNGTPNFRAFTNGVANLGIMVRETPGGTDVHYNGNVQDGSWYHVAYVLDAAANQGRLYVDGVLAGSTSYSGSISIGADWFLLGQNGAHGAAIDYDRYRVWSDALTDTQIGEIVAGNR